MYEKLSGHVLLISILRQTYVYDPLGKLILQNTLSVDGWEMDNSQIRFLYKPAKDIRSLRHFGH